MARDNSEPLFDIDTQLKRPHVTIDGEPHFVFHPEELSVIKHHRFVRAGERIRELEGKTGDETEKELDALVDKVAGDILVDTPKEIFAKITGAQRLKLVQVFTALLLRSAVEVAGAMHKAAGTTPLVPMPIEPIGGRKSRSWFGSTISTLWRSFTRFLSGSSGA